ncbi:MAG: nuclear transport factor 2 family protein [Acidobacteria bacterium]|nr:nuclear transport factor 2 family protein [Acidobacteriota bacterium]
MLKVQRVVMAGLLLSLIVAPVVGVPNSAAAAGVDPGMVIDRFYDAYRSGSVEGMLALYAPDAVFEDVNQRHLFTGAEQIRAMLTGIVGLHEVIDLREKRRVTDGDMVVVEYEYAGRLSGAALSQATGREGCPDIDYALPTTSWYRVEGGRIVHQKDFIDLATFMELQQKAAAAHAEPTD